MILFGDDNWIKYLQLTDKAHHHPPVFDGTDKTVPTDLQDKSVVDEIEEVNKGEVRCKQYDFFLLRAPYRGAELS